ncbi:MAG: endonuclease domain-containing protein [Planctomycetaceae bacterium]|nr:endonuclease domain-containing protein [Planctomycetaceae bacterium]
MSESRDSIQRARRLRRDQTVPESLLWNAFRAKRVCGLKFRRQHPIGPFFADLACPAKMLILEIDGDYHDATQSADLERQAYLESRGWRVLRFSNADVLGDVDAVVRNVTQFLGLEYVPAKRERTESSSLTHRISHPSPPQE